MRQQEALGDVAAQGCGRANMARCPAPDAAATAGVEPPQMLAGRACSQIDGRAHKAAPARGGRGADWRLGGESAQRPARERDRIQHVGNGGRARRRHWPPRSRNMRQPTARAKRPRWQPGLRFWRVVCAPGRARPPRARRSERIKGARQALVQLRRQTAPGRLVDGIVRVGPDEFGGIAFARAGRLRLIDALLELVEVHDVFGRRR